MKTQVKPKKNRFIEQLKSSFNRKKVKNSGFSWRLLASKIRVSHAFLSGVLNEKKAFPTQRLDDLIEALELDDFGRRRLLQAHFEFQLNKLKSESKSLKRFLEEKSEGKSRVPSVYAEVPFQKVDLFQNWYTPVLLDHVETERFSAESKSISRALGISEYQATKAWEYLVNSGLVEKDPNGRWKKASLKLRMPIKSSTLQMRRFYKELFAKASLLMDSKPDQESFDKRMIMGVTCSANLNQWPKIKNQIEEQLYSNAEELSEGSCQQVYGLVSIAIPLTQS